jgi:hypothetical protein
MRRIFTALALPLLLLGLAAAQKGPDRESENLLGPVRSVRSQMTEYSEGFSKEDTKGNEVERTIYDDYGFLVGKEVHAHDADGNLVESVLSDPKGVVLDRQVYAYADGKLAEIVSHDGKGDVGLREVSAYDEDGRLSAVTYYEGKEAAGRTAYSYDGKGRVSEAAFYLADGSKAVAPVGPCLGAHRVAYSYDDMGRPVKVIAYEPDGKLKKSWQYSYNSGGQIAEDIREDAWSRTTFVYAYEYDSRRNWIKQIATVDDQPKHATEMAPFKRRTIISREIAYY